MATILTDLDGSIFEFTEHFEQWALREGYPIKTGILGNTYDFRDMFDYEIDVEEFLSGFFACDETFSSFNALRGCAEPIQRLHAQGWDFVGVTACDDREGLAGLRARNFKTLFGFDPIAIHVTGYSGTKENVLKAYEPTIWVEDNLHNALLGADHGHRVFLIDHPYNQGSGPFTRVHDWHDIENIISLREVAAQ